MFFILAGRVLLDIAFWVINSKSAVKSVFLVSSGFHISRWEPLLCELYLPYRYGVISTLLISKWVFFGPFLIWFCYVSTWISLAILLRIRSSYEAVGIWLLPHVGSFHPPFSCEFFPSPALSSPSSRTAMTRMIVVVVAVLVTVPQVIEASCFKCFLSVAQIDHSYSHVPMYRFFPFLSFLLILPASFKKFFFGTVLFHFKFTLEFSLGYLFLKLIFLKVIYLRGREGEKEIVCSNYWPTCQMPARAGTAPELGTQSRSFTWKRNPAMWAFTAGSQELRW